MLGPVGPKGERGERVSPLSVGLYSLHSCLHPKTELSVTYILIFQGPLGYPGERGFRGEPVSHLHPADWRIIECMGGGTGALETTRNSFALK